MRHQVVLYVAVFLCVLKLAAGACTANQGALLFADGTCVCDSGFNGAACETPADAAVCGSHLSTAPPTQAERFPVLDLVTAAYTSNTLKLSVLGPYVNKRQYTGITFVNQTSDSCSLGSSTSFWTSTFDASVCEDRFYISLPWARHGDCGFKVVSRKEDSTNDLANENNQTAIAENHYVVYSAKFTLYYVDNLGDIEGFQLTRNTSVPYQIFVQFPTQLDVSLENVNITSVVDMGIALTGDSYNPDNGELTMEITILNSWPNMLGEAIGMWTVVSAADGVSQIGTVTQVATNTCPDDEEGSICKQTFQFLFTTSGCTYDGKYNISAPVYTCRGSEYTSCTQSMFYLVFDLETSSICSNITVEAPLSGRLVPFHNFVESDFLGGDVTPFAGPATDGFRIGQYGYFQIQMDDVAMQGNDVYLKIFEVSFQANNLGNKNYLVKNGVVMNDNTNDLGASNPDQAFHYEEARFEFMDRQINASADYTNLKAFKLYFSSVVFKVLPTFYNTYTFRVSAYVTYLGNAGETDQGQKKRVVEFTYEASADKLSTFAKVGLNEAEAYSEKGLVVPPSDNISYIVGGGAAGLVAVAAAVFAVVRSKKNSYKTLAESRA